MEMNGEYRIPASRQAVWEALNDPTTLKAAIPGCDTLDKVSDTELTAAVMIRVGPVKAKFKGRVTLSDIDPPNSLTISGEGQGGAAGFGKGDAKVSLGAEGNETVLRYAATAQVGGKLAQIGARLIDGAAKKLADEFFSSFVDAVAPAAEAVPVAAPPPAAPEGLAPVAWSSLLVAVVLVILVIVATI
ncbi:MAG TPA: carbon monoxide dehydrogenase subunit G [Alphaproteobacteria bacterium]|jgi:hypothetical protein|nr:carbon monoxide dehydrogenase subunit G [Alphaproteobacteria bacterium]